jgi:tetratricopeptide (TPR) repeat protein
MLIANQGCRDPGHPLEKALSAFGVFGRWAAGVFGRWTAALLTAGALAAGCAGPDSLPLDKLAPEVFLEERRLQDEVAESGEEEAALERITVLLDSERSAAALTLAARIEKDPEQALAFLREAIEKDPEFAWARYGFAFIVLKEEMLARYDESAANLEWLIERGFDDYWGPELKTRRLLIENLSRLGRPEDEAEQWEEYLERYPLNLEARYNLARLLCIKMQEPKEALRHIDRILAEDPEALDARMLKGRALWDRGRYNQAAEVYETLARLHPNALLNLAILYERHLDDPARALEYYERYRDYEGYNQSKRRWYDLNFLVPRRIEALSGGSS